MATSVQRHSPERAWLLRALLVLQSPRSVFAAIRDDSDEAAGARSEALLALVWLAGSLYVAMAVHVVYDITAGITYGRLGRELGYVPRAATPGSSASL